MLVPPFILASDSKSEPIQVELPKYLFEMIDIIVFISSLLLTVGGLLLFLRINSTLGMIDVPNERSSHARPVPRGGGLVIVLVSLSLYVTISSSRGATANWFFVGSAMLIAGISLLDDIFTIPLFPRLIVHICAAVTMVYSTGGFTSIYIPIADNAVNLGAIGPFVTAVFIVWMINAFNFMDGIDGIAGMQGLFAGAGWLILGVLSNTSGFTSIGLIFIGTCLGFLFFNWQPAKIFMGDVGSTYLGFSFACIPLIFTDSSTVPLNQLFYLSIMFAWLFLYDTGITRILQIFKRRRFWMPHREHQYQLLVIAGLKHRTVSLFFGLTAAAIGIFSVLAVFRSDIFGVFNLIVVFLSSVALSFWTLKKRLT